MPDASTEYNEFSPEDEAPSDARYFVDTGGSTVRIPVEHASLAREQGYLPAGEDQVKAYDSVRELAKKYGGVGGGLAAGIQSAGSLLTFGGTDVLQSKLAPYLPEGTLHTAEELETLQHLHPYTSTAGAIAALAPGLVAGVARKGLGLIGAEGLSKAIPATIPTVGAPAAIGAAGHALSGLAEKILPQATGYGMAALRGVAKLAPALAAESALYGAQNVAHEQALGDPRSMGEALVSEVGPDALFGTALAVPFGVGGGLLSHLKGLATEGHYPLPLKDAEAVQVARAMGEGAATKRVTNSMIDTLGHEKANEALIEMGEAGFGAPASTARRNLEMATEMQKSQGIENLVKDVSSTLAPELQPKWSKILEKVSKQELAPLESGTLSHTRRAAKMLAEGLDEATAKFKDRMSMEDLYALRREVDDGVRASGGYTDEGAMAYNKALRGYRSVLAGEMKNAVERSGRPVKDLTTRLRNYQLAEYAKDFADAAIKEKFGPAENNGLGIGSGAFVGYHLASGLTGGALPLATVGGAMVGRTVSRIAQRYAPGALAWALRRLRQGVSFADVAADLKSGKAAIESGEKPTPPSGTSLTPGPVGAGGMPQDVSDLLSHGEGVQSPDAASPTISPEELDKIEAELIYGNSPVAAEVQAQYEKPAAAPEVAKTPRELAQQIADDGASLNPSDMPKNDYAKAVNKLHEREVRLVAQHPELAPSLDPVNVKRAIDALDEGLVSGEEAGKIARGDMSLKKIAHLESIKGGRETGEAPPNAALKAPMLRIADELDVPEEYREEMVDKTLHAVPKEAEESGIEETPITRKQSTTVITPSRPQGERARYIVVPIEDLVPSHNPVSFAPSQEYPAGVQTRDYLRPGPNGEVNPERLKVETYQGQRRFNPDSVMGTDPYPVSGPPMVTAGPAGEKRLVLGGNGRTMMTVRAMQDPAVREQYQRELQARASRFGVDPVAVGPGDVIVREMTDIPTDSTPEELAAAVHRFNEVPTTSLGPKAKAVADAKMLSPVAVKDIGDMLAGSSDKSLRDLMREKPADLIRVLENPYHGDPVINAVNRAEWVTGGNLTDTAKDRIEGMFLGRLLGSGDRAVATGPGITRKLERIAPSVLRVAGSNPQFDETQVIRAAVDLLNEAESRDVSLDRLTKQTGLFEKGVAPSDPAAIMADLIDKSTPTSLQKAFGKWANEASADLRQANMFKAPATAKSVRSMLSEALAGAEPLPAPRQLTEAEQKVASKSAELIANERAGRMTERMAPPVAMGTSSGPMAGMGNAPLPPPAPAQFGMAPERTQWPVALGPTGLPAEGSAGPTMQPPLFIEGQPSGWKSPAPEGMGVQDGRGATPEGAPPVPEDVNKLNNFLDRLGPIESQASDSPKTMQALGLMQETADKAKARITSLASTLVRAGPKALAVGRNMAAPGISSIMGLSDDDMRNKYEKVTDQIRSVASDPTMTTQMISRATAGVHEHAPAVSIAAAETLTRAATFLATKIPQGPQDQSPFQSKSWKPSSMEIRSFLRSYAVVNSPDLVLRKAAAGTIIPSDIQALETVYPALAGQYRQAVVEQSAKHGLPTNANARMGIAILTGVPLPGGLPASFAANQAVYATSQKQPAAPRGKPIAASRIPGGGKNGRTPAARATLSTDQAVSNLDRP